MKKLTAAFFMFMLIKPAVAEDDSIRRQAYIEKQRIQVTRLMDVLAEIKELRVEYDATGLSGTFVDSDFVASNNNHISPAQFANTINSEQAIVDLLTANGNAHNTNLYLLVR